MRRLFDAVLSSTVSCRCRAGAPVCFLALVPQFKDMRGIQVSFFRHVCQLGNSITSHIIITEIAERPWLDSWWSTVLGCMRHLSLLPGASLHLHILQDNIARQPLICAEWPLGVDKQTRNSSMGFPYACSGIGALDSLGIMGRLAKHRVGELPRLALDCVYITVGLDGQAVSCLDGQAAHEHHKALSSGADQAWISCSAH